MASLTETAVMVRKLIKISVVGIISVVILRMGLFFYDTYIKVVNPPPPPPPNVAFGKLPEIEFSHKLHPELTLRLETPTGGTPDLGERAEVLLMPAFRSNFLALDEAVVLAKQMGFVNKAQEITERRYRWEADEFLPSTLEMDIINGAFVLKRNWQADPTILTDKQLPGKEQTEVESINFLRQINLMTEELKEARVEISYLTFKAGQYQEAISLSEADFVQADLFRPKIQEIPVLPEDPSKGIVRIIFSGSVENEKRIIQAEYGYFPVNLEETGEYPIKSASEAWRELQTRQGFIANIGDNPSDVIAIRRIYLAYFDSPTPTGFLMPIIVFEGDNGFFGYVSAVTEENIIKANETGAKSLTGEEE